MTSQVSPISTSTIPVPTQRVGVVAPSFATFLYIDNIEELLGPQMSQNKGGYASSNIYWEQDGYSYKLKSEEVSGPTRVDVNLMQKHRLSKISDPRQYWRAASSRTKIWADPNHPLGKQILQHVNQINTCLLYTSRCV